MNSTSSNWFETPLTILVPEGSVNVAGETLPCGDTAGMGVFHLVCPRVEGPIERGLEQVHFVAAVHLLPLQSCLDVSDRKTECPYCCRTRDSPLSIKHPVLTTWWNKSFTSILALLRQNHCPVIIHQVPTSLCLFIHNWTPEWSKVKCRWGQLYKVNKYNVTFFHCFSFDRWMHHFLSQKNLYLASL